MIFHGRWVPSEVMDTILLLWIVMIAIIVCVLLRVGWRRRPNPREQGKLPMLGRKRRVRRKK